METQAENWPLERVLQGLTAKLSSRSLTFDFDAVLSCSVVSDSLRPAGL